MVRNVEERVVRLFAFGLKPAPAAFHRASQGFAGRGLADGFTGRACESARIGESRGRGQHSIRGRAFVKSQAAAIRGAATVMSRHWRGQRDHGHRLPAAARPRVFGTCPNPGLKNRSVAA